jgi:hypothetical protein
VAVCQYDSARVEWSTEGNTLSKKIAEYAFAVIKDKPSLHINFIMDVSPDCDCWGHNDMPLVADIGIAVSKDPVALDRACADMVVAAPASPHLMGEGGDLSGVDKFGIVHKNTDWNTILEHAGKIKLGTSSYKLTRI